VTSILVVDQSRVVAAVNSTHIQPVVGFAYTSPIAGLVYTYASVSAILDNTGAFKYFSEQALFTDSKAYSLTKYLSDSFEQQEIVAKTVSRPATDSVSLTDSLRRSTAKAATDLFGASDALSFTSQRNLQTNEVGVLTDIAAKNFSKAIQHNIWYVPDYATLSVEKVLSDDFGVSDSIFVQRVYLRAFDEYLTIADDLAFSFNGLDGLENLVVNDSQLFVYAKVFSDGVSMNDALGAGDGIAYTFATSISNIAFVSEALAKSSQTIKSETLAATDSGIIVQQDYVDLTYFAEDYVGVSYTF
jgi:hypothetical protein